MMLNCFPRVVELISISLSVNESSQFSHIISEPWYLIMVLMCISLIIDIVVHFLKFWFLFLFPLLWKVVYIFCSYSIGLFAFFILICKITLYILKTKLRFLLCIANIFSQFVTCFYLLYLWWFLMYRKSYF